MTTVAIDCRFIGTGTGLARYTSEIVTALLARPDTDCTYVLLVRQEDVLPAVPLPHRVVTVDIPHYSLAEQTRLPAILRSLGADVVFFPHFNAPFFCPLPMVVTVHDLILHRYPGNASLSKRIAYRILLHRAIRRARTVIAVSAWTKRDLVRTYGPWMSSKTVTIGEGVSELYVPPTSEQVQDIRSRYGLTGPYFLYVGNCKPHKNVPFLIDAFTRAQTDATLVLVSGGDDAQVLSLPNVRVLRAVPERDMPVLYGGARASVTASLEEGYYLPAAEALACGCPVIATNRAAIPEVVGSHGMLLEPTLDAFVEAFRHPPQRPTPVRVASWADAAERIAAVLQQR